MSKPIDWPNGADVDRVRECNCEWCNELMERLESDDGAVSAGQAGLNAFAGDDDD